MVGDLSHHNMIFMFCGRIILVTKSVINVFLHYIGKTQMKSHVWIMKTLNKNNIENRYIFVHIVSLEKIVTYLDYI